MNKRLKDLLFKKAKEGKFLSPEEKAAKIGVLGEVSDMMKEVMGNDLKKVTVAAPDAEGLKAGLEKAKEVVEKKEEAEEKEEEMVDEEGYDQEMEEPEMSKEDRIAQLREELAMLEDESEPVM